MFRTYAIKDIRYDFKNFTLNSDYSKLDNFKYIDLDKTKTYFNCKLNEHHWTTSFIWNVFLPEFLSDLNLNFNPSEFKYVLNDNTDNKAIFDYHNPINDYEFNIFNLNTNFEIITNFSNVRLNTLNNGFGRKDLVLTPYHKLFFWSHETVLIKNEFADTDRCLLLNCDSMMIPIIPILIKYFKIIFVYDNRTQNSYKELVETYVQNVITDIVFCYIEENIVLEKWKNIFK